MEAGVPADVPWIRERALAALRQVDPPPFEVAGVEALLSRLTQDAEEIEVSQDHPGKIAVAWNASGVGHSVALSEAARAYWTFVGRWFAGTIVLAPDLVLATQCGGAGRWTHELSWRTVAYGLRQAPSADQLQRLATKLQEEHPETGIPAGSVDEDYDESGRLARVLRTILTELEIEYGDFHYYPDRAAGRRSP